MPARERKILKHPGLKPLWDGLEREWKQQQLTAVGLLVMGITVLTYGAFERSLLWLLSGSLLACGALWWLWRLAAEQPVAAWYQLFANEPETVAWVYSLVTERLPFGLKFSASATLYLILNDGEELAATLPAKDVKLVTKTLNRVLPQAEFGYSPEREAKYRRSRD